MVLVVNSGRPRRACFQSSENGIFRRPPILTNESGDTPRLMRVGIRLGLIHDRPKCQAVFFGQILGPGQVSQQRCQRAVTQHLGQRAEPPADELVTIQHRAKT